MAAAACRGSGIASRWVGLGWVCCFVLAGWRVGSRLYWRAFYVGVLCFGMCLCTDMLSLDVWIYDPGMGPDPPRVRRNLNVSPRGNSGRAFPDWARAGVGAPSINGSEARKMLD